jgi:hypothetical protein
MPQGNPKNVKPSPPMREVTPNAKKAKKGKQKGSKENISPGISKANLFWNNIYIYIVTPLLTFTTGKIHPR